MVVKYDEFTQDDERIKSILPEQFYKYMRGVDTYTDKTLGDMWCDNISYNVKHYLPDHGNVTDNFLDFGKDKAVVMVGSGPSLKKNINVLKQIYDFNLKFDLKNQPFIIISANHEFKNLIDEGIFPHFIMVNDGGEHFHDQLLKDVPKRARNSILLSTLAASPKLIKGWLKQGGVVNFFMNKGKTQTESFKKASNGKDPERFSLAPGGNVMNSGFVLALSILHAKVFMCIGNDLCFPFDSSYEVRKSLYYADGKYTPNIASTRDEARDNYTWMAYEHCPSIFKPDENRVNFKPMMTSRTLFTYKVWIEMHVGAWSRDLTFNYFNCTEGGILGVVAKQHKKKRFHDKENWVMMDELFPGRWITAPLMTAVSKFLEAKKLCQIHSAINYDAGLARRIWLPKTGFAPDADRLRLN